MKILFQVLFFFIITILKGQDIDKLASIPVSIENKKEIRIYQGSGITNGGKVFRIYQEKGENWKAEVIQWRLPYHISKDESEIIPAKVIQLKSKDILEKAFVTLEAMNIGYLPNEDLFRYKMSRSKAVYDNDEKGYVLFTREYSVTDGVDFLVKYKSDNRENEFHYSNPESYLKDTPGIDEYESFIKILKYVEDNFNIKLD
ncbi:hypothetical protein C1637_24550 [Chryseobacterium lactis]|uniref:DUF4468 domain-containing protein n=1 Tax=Chryseobacterium lactis TaxID=1241981 RepID=A0A3G6RT78_CHRLC|nr:hypothetical protein [Chryseobacterium lactis]AZA81985.1 hypothetical protein EG342_08720 [Chryseobacterium lactis]AZB06983.1 hypothetical protein EG341_24835 [Chryseobacterium lactis]PNW11070.1 hypothetical protein C1637_24550 [Chryseobacterium lactis]